MAEIYISVKCLFDGLGILTWYGEDDLALDGRITVASMTFAINLLLSNAAPARIKRKNAASPIPGNTSSPTDETDDKNNCCRRQALKPTMLTENQDMVPTNSPKRWIHTPFHACVDGQDLWERGSRENPDTGWLSVHAQHQFIRDLFRGPQTMSYAITYNALDLVKLLFSGLSKPPALHDDGEKQIALCNMVSGQDWKRSQHRPRNMGSTLGTDADLANPWSEERSLAAIKAVPGCNPESITTDIPLPAVVYVNSCAVEKREMQDACTLAASFLSGLLPPFEVDLDGLIGKQLTLIEREKLSRSESRNMISMQEMEIEGSVSTI